MEWYFWFAWWFLFYWRIQDYFEFIIKKNETLTENPPIEIYANKIKNRIVFKIKAGYKLELLSLEAMKLLGMMKKMLIEIKMEKMWLESAEVVLVHCNLVNNNYQQASKALFTFWPNKQFWQLINIVPHFDLLIKIVSLSKLKIMLIFWLAFKKSDTQHNQNLGNTLKDIHFCHLQENLVINMVKN